LNVSLKHPKNLLVTLDGHLQSRKQTLGRVEIHNDPLLDMDRILGNPNRLWIQTKVDNQLFWGSSDSAKVRIQGNRVFVLDLYGDLLNCLGATNWVLAGFLLYFVGHRSFFLQKTTNKLTGELPMFLSNDPHNLSLWLSSVDNA
jgi:hypothetical protein